jgi:chemotaxis protein histidine kinase CheA
VELGTQVTDPAVDFLHVNSAVARAFQTVPDVSQAVELRRVRMVTGALERLLDSTARREGRDRELIAETVARGVDLLELLARDASRRLDGHAPALLDDAVQSLLNEVERITSAPSASGRTEIRGLCVVVAEQAAKASAPEPVEGSPIAS